MQGLENAKVSNLFKTGLNEWDYDLLRDIFNQEDIERIIKIPVAHTTQGVDKWFWLEDVKGQYTVKSGYRLLSSSLPHFSANNIPFKWLRLWNLSISPKVKNFLWRVMHDCLPTLENLKRKFVDVNPICQVCKLVVESVEHILLGCLFANKCWELSKINLIIAAGQSFTQMVVNLFDTLSLKDLELICSVMWSIWNHRNSVVWNNLVKTCIQVTNEASSSLFQWQQAQVTQNRQSNCLEREGMMVWHPPLLVGKSAM